MGIFDALTTAVSGLQAQSFALQNISGNIANSQTVGYKETDTQFQDLVYNAALDQETAGGVFASSTSSNTVQGTLTAASSPTDMAVDGDGYFVVTQPDNASGSRSTFSGVAGLYPPWRLYAQQQRLSGQRRRLLPDGHSAQSGNRARPQPAHQPFCNSTAASCRPRQRRRSIIRLICHRRRLPACSLEPIIPDNPLTTGNGVVGRGW